MKADIFIKAVKVHCLYPFHVLTLCLCGYFLDSLLKRN
jgi:hypothetical protein